MIHLTSEKELAKSQYDGLLVKVWIWGILSLVFAATGVGFFFSLLCITFVCGCLNKRAALAQKWGFED